MSNWRDMLARFRKPLPDHEESDGGDGAVATLTISPYATAPLHENFRAESEAAPDDNNGTQLFDDSTRALSSVAPQLAVVLGEPVLQAAALRDVGRERHENQDHCFAQVFAFPTDEGEVPLGLFIIADGMGGHHDGGYASRLALTTVARAIISEFINPWLEGDRRAPQPIMQAAVQAANAAVFDAGQAAGNDMGTTCTATLLYGDELITAHVGDSRALLLGGSVQPITTDHSAVGRLIAIGALTPEEAREHPLRNQLYRSIGQGADVAVDVVTTKIGSARQLVLCSDGLWGLVPEDELLDIVAEAPTPQVAARHLIARANLLGGDDNISVVVVALPRGAAA